MINDRILKRIYTNKTSLFGLVIVVFFLLVALFAPVLAPVENPELVVSVVIEKAEIL